MLQDMRADTPLPCHEHPDASCLFAALDICRDGRYLAAVCATGVEIVDMQSSTLVSDHSKKSRVHQYT